MARWRNQHRKPQGFFRFGGKKWTKNSLQADYAFVLGMLLGGHKEYALTTAYLEFQNVASPGDPADIITFDFTEGVEYYIGLSASADRDYLKVPLVLGRPTVDAANAAIFPKGNDIRGFAVSNGIVGVHGKPFSENDNSVLCAAAVVATPDINDPTQDLIFARWSAAEEDQWPAVDGKQTTVNWKLPFSAV